MDLLVAILEGLFYAEAPVEAWVGWTTHPADTVRWTAVKNTVLAGGDVNTEDPVERELIRAAEKERRTVFKRP